MGFWTSIMRHLINISYLAKLLVFRRVSVLPVIGPVGWRELSGHHWLSGQFWYRLKVEIVWEWEKKTSINDQGQRKEKSWYIVWNTGRHLTWSFQSCSLAQVFLLLWGDENRGCWHCRWCPEPMLACQLKEGPCWENDLKLKKKL